MLLEFFVILPLIICIFWISFILLGRYYNKAFLYLVLVYLDIFFILLSFTLYIYYQHSLNCHINAISVLSALIYYPLLYTYILLLIGDKKWKSSLRKGSIIPISLSVLTISASYTMPDEEFSSFLAHIVELKGAFRTFSIFGKIRIVLFYVNIAFLYYEIVFFTYKIIRRLNEFDDDMKNRCLNSEDRVPKSTNILYSIIISTSFLNICIPLKLFALSSDSPFFIVVSSILCCFILFFLGLSSVKEILYLENNASGINSDRLDTATYGIHRKEYNDDNLHLREGLLELFNTKGIYKNQGLKISDVAYLLNTNRTYVSNLINNNLGSSFSDFVNEFRVGHAKKMLSNPDYQYLTLSEIAEQSGFSSNNSFYRSFKRFTKVSPHQYRLEKLYDIYTKNN